MTVTRADPATIITLAELIGAAINDAIDQRWDYNPTVIVGRNPGCDTIAVRPSSVNATRAGCAGDLTPTFTVAMSICIDDDPKQTNTKITEASGIRIARIMWSGWAGMIHNLWVKGWKLDTVGVLNCDDVTFGQFDITYGLGMAIGTGTIVVNVPIVLDANA